MKEHIWMLMWVCYHFLGNVIGQNTFNNNIVSGQKKLWKYVTKSDVAFALFVIDTYFDCYKQCAQNIKEGGTGRIEQKDWVKTKHELALADDEKNGCKKFIELVEKITKAVDTCPKFEDDFQKYYSDRHQEQDKASSRRQNRVDDLDLERSKSYNQGVQLEFYNDSLTKLLVEAAQKNPWAM